MTEDDETADDATVEGADGEPVESADEEGEFEAHRAIVREINKKIGAYYGYGGAVAFGAAGATAGLVGWWWGFVSVAPWLLAAVVFLLVMLVLRALLARAADREHDRVTAYCEANDVSVEELRRHYGQQNVFPYFEALFEIRERRAQVGRDPEQTSE